MTELYINGRLMDLIGDESIEVDYAVFDINKLGKRGGARSYEFNLPKTNNNKEVLENPEMVNNLSDVPYTRLPCLVLVDGVDVLIRFAEVQSVKSFYSIRVYGANSDIFATLKDLPAIDLDLSEYDHFRRSNLALNLNEVYLSRTNTEGYIYPIIDWHLDSPNYAINNDDKTVRIDYFLPAIFYKTVLNRIFTELGYTLVDEIEADTANLLLTSGNNQRNHLVERYNSSFTHDDNTTLTNPLASIFVHPPFTTVVEGSSYFRSDIIDNRQALYSQQIVQGWIFANQIRCRLTFSFTLENTGGTGIFITTTARVGSTDFTIPRTFLPQNTPITFTGTVYGETNETFPRAQLFFLWEGIGSMVYKAGANVQITECEYLNDSADTYNYYPQAISSGLTYNIFSTLDYVTVSSIMQDLSQMDIVTNYIMLFGLMPVVNEWTKEVRFIKFDSILGKLNQAYDWSDKIDFSDDHEVKFINDAYAQNNWFRYAEDGDEEKPLNADGNLPILNDNLEYETDVVELAYGATNKVFRLNDLGEGTNEVNQIGVYTQGEHTDIRLVRVLNLDMKDSGDIGGNMIYDDQVMQLAFLDSYPFTTFIQDGNDFNLGFGDNLLTDYYDLLSNILNRSKIVKVDVRLSAADISQLDFSRPVWISHFESYFYISAIKAFSYTESRSTLVELVKLNIHG